MPTPELRTDRLLMRGWTDADRDAFAEINADPEVMAHFPAPLTRARSDALVDRIERQFDQHGYGLWALDRSGELLGFTGLLLPGFHAPFMDTRPQPVVEVGWRLRRSAWGHGFATEAARESLRFGFEELGLAEILSFTVVENLRSQAVMRRLGMRLLTAYDHPIPGAAGPLPSVAYVLPAPDAPQPRPAI